MNKLNNANHNVIATEADLVYLRKSRTDNPADSVEEVLIKHETMLQELAVKELGGRIPEQNFFREVISGETIDERPEMLRLLSAIENPVVKRVWVVEPQRLTRGDLEDCGRVVNALRYSGTQVVTLTMTYDLTNKMHRKFFEQELLRGNDYLEYTKEILLRGRIASVERGNYIGNIPPFGYDKITDEIGPTLVPNDDADAVRLVFNMYVHERKSPLQIARHLDSLGVRPVNSEVWEQSSIRAILRNEHYIGKVRFGGRKTERIYTDGQLVKRRSVPSPEEKILRNGRHQALVSQELFDAVKEIRGSNPKSKIDHTLKNPLAGLIFCSVCGKAMIQHPYAHARTRIECRDRNGCGAKSIPLDEVLDSVLHALKNEHLPDLEARLRNNDGNAYAIQQKQISKMRAELAELQKQEIKQYELVEKGVYTDEIFTVRNKALHVEMDALKSRIYEANNNLPKEVDYGMKIVKLKDAIDALGNDKLEPAVQNKFLKAIIQRVDYEFIRREGKGKTVYRLHIRLKL